MEAKNLDFFAVLEQGEILEFAGIKDGECTLFRQKTGKSLDVSQLIDCRSDIDKMVAALRIRYLVNILNAVLLLLGVELTVEGLYGEQQKLDVADEQTPTRVETIRASVKFLVLFNRFFEKI